MVNFLILKSFINYLLTQSTVGNYGGSVGCDNKLDIIPADKNNNTTIPAPVEALFLFLVDSLMGLNRYYSQIHIPCNIFFQFLTNYI